MHPSERLKGLDVFVCVADAGSFTAAAERLHLTASAVGKSIARLEERLGRRLFHRTTRRMSLTEAGIAFHRTCIAVLADLEEAEVSLRAEDAEPSGRVRIDLPAAFGRLQALPIILGFAQAYPLARPQVSFSDRFIDPVEDGVDILVRIGGPDSWSTQLEHRLLGHERHVFCAAPAYLAAHGVPATLQDLEAHRCIAYGRADGSISPWRFAAATPGEVDHRVIPSPLVVGDGEGQVTAALVGCGIVQLPTWLVRSHLEDGALMEVLPDLASEGLPLTLAWMKSRQDLPTVSLLLDALAEGLAPRIR
ncbi:LysR family transcriptional regulator [Stenotrophomonas sp. SY1]|uniref:LysR family transcriptional regulator n=1 Tax=Stenotrophomonas sp. SY1 TaxID=477235 RepID=UPI001E2E3E1D|nr:LysR family transcriptional regulator [Stenotrophomonas sp. SY1]MCD9085403.1 LysR family transcriptional regulator [Stenotrophomonas sp. SY1]